MKKQTRTRRPRRGLTLVEVIIAMGLLAGVLLSLGQFSAALARSSGTARLTAIAAQLVGDRLETVKGAPRYSAIESLYVKTETTIPGFAGFSRSTNVRRVGGTADTVDFKVITVEVSHSSLAKPVRKSTVMSVW